MLSSRKGHVSCFFPPVGILPVLLIVVLFIICNKSADKHADYWYETCFQTHEIMVAAHGFFSRYLDSSAYLNSNLCSEMCCSLNPLETIHVGSKGAHS